MRSNKDKPATTKPAKPTLEVGVLQNEIRDLLKIINDYENLNDDNLKQPLLTANPFLGDDDLRKTVKEELKKNQLVLNMPSMSKLAIARMATDGIKSMADIVDDLVKDKQSRETPRKPEKPKSETATPKSNPVNPEFVKLFDAVTNSRNFSAALYRQYQATKKSFTPTEQKQLQKLFHVSLEKNIKQVLAMVTDGNEKSYSHAKFQQKLRLEKRFPDIKYSGWRKLVAKELSAVLQTEVALQKFLDDRFIKANPPAQHIIQAVREIKLQHAATKPDSTPEEISQAVLINQLKNVSSKKPFSPQQYKSFLAAELFNHDRIEIGKLFAKQIREEATAILKAITQYEKTTIPEEKTRLQKQYAFLSDAAKRTQVKNRFSTKIHSNILSTSDRGTLKDIYAYSAKLEVETVLKAIARYEEINDPAEKKKLQTKYPFLSDKAKTAEAKSKLNNLTIDNLLTDSDRKEIQMISDRSTDILSAIQLHSQAKSQAEKKQLESKYHFLTDMSKTSRIRNLFLKVEKNDLERITQFIKEELVNDKNSKGLNEAISTWNQSVDKTKNEFAKKVNELFTSEQTFRQNMRALSDHFIADGKLKPNNAFMQEGQDKLSDNERKHLFSLMSPYKEIADSDPLINLLNPYGPFLSDAELSQGAIPFEGRFEVALTAVEKYCDEILANPDKFLNSIQQCNLNAAKTNQFLKTMDDIGTLNRLAIKAGNETATPEVSSYTIQAIQRGPRYGLFLNEFQSLLKKIDPTHPLNEKLAKTTAKVMPYINVSDVKAMPKEEKKEEKVVKKMWHQVKNRLKPKKKVAPLKTNIQDFEQYGKGAKADKKTKVDTIRQELDSLQGVKAKMDYIDSILKNKKHPAHDHEYKIRGILGQESSIIQYLKEMRASLNKTHEENEAFRNQIDPTRTVVKELEKPAQAKATPLPAGMESTPTVSSQPEPAKSAGKSEKQMLLDNLDQIIQIAESMQRTLGDLAKRVKENTSSNLESTLRANSFFQPKPSAAPSKPTASFQLNKPRVLGGHRK